MSTLRPGQELPEVWVSLIVFRCYPPDGGYEDVRATLIYRELDPTVISVQFHSAEACTWAWGRDLLREGMLRDAARPAGFGDLKVWTAGDWVWIALDTPDGSVRMSALESELAPFVRDTYEHVPDDEQQWQIDELIAEILEEATR